MTRFAVTIFALPRFDILCPSRSAFTDHALPGDHEPRNPNHHRVILALATAFWDAYLRGDRDALAWLNGARPRSVMEPADDWKAVP
jgi:hypothetical protein